MAVKVVEFTQINSKILEEFKFTTFVKVSRLVRVIDELISESDVRKIGPRTTSYPKSDCFSTKAQLFKVS